MSGAAPDPMLFNPVGGHRPGTNPDSTLTVTQVTHLVKQALRDRLPSKIHVVGEISNFKQHSSGHLYFVLKDGQCELSCVMWRTAAAQLKFGPTNGLEVVATGHVDVFERSGRYQMYVRRIEPRGVGALELAFRQLRERLEREGLFDASHKKPLPRFPERVAVVTSPTGAAVRDIIKTMNRRFPCLNVLIYPVTVQGPSAVTEIADAITRLNRHAASLGGVDVMIVGRGGGSLEDLWAFNEEIVARAIFESVIPVVSAVGHEVDVSISDLVADVRAATPTAAAEIISPVREELLADLDERVRRWARTVGHNIEMGRASLTGLLERRMMREPLSMVQQREQGVDELVNRLQTRVQTRLFGIHRRVGAAEVTLQRIRPDAYVARMHRRLSEAGHRLGWAASHRCVESERSLASRFAGFTAATPKTRVARWLDHVDGLAKRLAAMSHKATLGRGFTITRKKKTGVVVRNPCELGDGEPVVTETADGSFESRVINMKQMELFDG